MEGKEAATMGTANGARNYGGVDDRARSVDEGTGPPPRPGEAAQMLIWTLSEWSRRKQVEANTGRRGKLHRMRTKAHEDEKSLCHSDWSTDLSLDQQAYSSVFHQLREASDEAESVCEFVAKAASILGNTLMVTVLLGIFMAFPVAMISIGVKFLHECPKEPRLPIYLLVGGCFGLLKLLSLMWKQIRARHYEHIDDVYEPDEDGGDVIMSKSSRFSEAVLTIFLLGWFACGNYWLFGIWWPHFRQPLHAPSDWCDETVYMFAFVQITVCYGVAAAGLLLALILATCHLICEART